MTTEEYLVKRILELEKELCSTEEEKNKLFSEVINIERTVKIIVEENKKLKEQLKELTNEKQI